MHFRFSVQNERINIQRTVHINATIIYFFIFIVVRQTMSKEDLNSIIDYYTIENS